MVKNLKMKNSHAETFMKFTITYFEQVGYSIRVPLLATACLFPLKNLYYSIFVTAILIPKSESS
jgi:hypothetical protein